MRLLIALSTILLSGCHFSTASVDSYIDPSYSAKEIKSVVVFPMTNAGISPGQAQELSRVFAQGLQRHNPQLQIMGAGEAIDKINEAGLADDWAVFLRNYNTSGIPNTKTARHFGAVLGVDAIIQGSILSLSQKDSSGYDYPTTRVNLRYGAISGKTGVMLWEISAEGSILANSYTAAPIIDAARIANNKVVDSLPD